MRSNTFLATLALLLCISFSMLGCFSKKISSKYSTDEINYFFELAFFDSEHPKTIQKLQKWESDISIAVTGDTIPGDQHRISAAIRQFQDLKLPIKMRLTNDTSGANVILNFTGHRNQKDKEQLGVTTTIAIDYAIKKAHIEILSDSTLTTSMNDGTRRSVILHELMHCLGLHGHSNRFSNGTLSTNCNTELKPIDQSVIKLLYETEIPCGYEGKDFEEDYADILVHVNAKPKLRVHVKRHGLQKVYSEILRFGLYDQKAAKPRELVKFSFPARVIIDAKHNFNSSIDDAITNLNKASKKIKLAKVDSATCRPGEGIFISIVFKPDLPQRVKTHISNTIYHDLKYELIGTSKIVLTYSDESLVPLALSNALFNVICLNSYPNPFKEINGRILLTPEAIEIAQAYYDPILPTGITDQELQEAISGL
ncbi:DUF2927 domain-containing protein [Pedobacter foliorum]|uniref:DUF2927 domain-containing protein n=1 Tax=Pedobacter foliorum TaxID=2739058 RepID=UPI001563ADD8|nr:DUF2927 domain-containing protein [Pedobacter foliorum]NRF39440.1 DUF2927 domain-containing protein [Pedobacter foliorum]